MEDNDEDSLSDEEVETIIEAEMTGFKYYLSVILVPERFCPTTGGWPIHLHIFKNLSKEECYDALYVYCEKLSRESPNHSRFKANKVWTLGGKLNGAFVQLIRRQQQ